jgi:acetyl esterase/lipase
MPETIELDTHDGSPSTRLEQPLDVGGVTLRMSRNVNRATLTSYVPHDATTAVIVGPGGGWHMLAIDHEGVDVARALRDRGIAGFLLEYRLLPTPIDETAFQTYAIQNMSDAAKLGALATAFRPSLMSDGRAALDHVRAQGFDRVGMVGFSAGGYLATQMAMGDHAPDFVASIYGAHIGGTQVPASAPPLFLALADDDPLRDLVRAGAFELHRAWHDAGRPVELHVYERGGHGFGIQAQGTPSDRWFDAMLEWVGDPF